MLVQFWGRSGLNLIRGQSALLEFIFESKVDCCKTVFKNKITFAQKFVLSLCRVFLLSREITKTNACSQSCSLITFSTVSPTLFFSPLCIMVSRKLFLLHFGGRLGSGSLLELNVGSRSDKYTEL